MIIKHMIGELPNIERVEFSDMSTEEQATIAAGIQFGLVDVFAGERWSSCCGVAPLDFFAYRIRPSMIKIGEFDVPEPERELLFHGESYFTPELYGAYYRQTRTWEGLDRDKEGLKRGLIHKTKESATRHGKALASLTEKQTNQGDNDDH